MVESRQNLGLPRPAFLGNGEPYGEVVRVRMTSIMPAAERIKNMAAALARGLPRMLVPPQRGWCNIIGYGPSLKHTWVAVNDDPIITTSGAHDFMISRGRIPKYHIECDPRAHKAIFTRTPHPDVHYLLASCCAPETFDNFGPEHKVSVWHCQEPDQELLDWIVANDPKGAQITFGNTVGTRAYNVAMFCGFENFRFFGIDCSFENGEQRAGHHNGDVHQVMEVGVRGDSRTFQTSHSLMLDARLLVNEIVKLAGVSQAQIYGSGLAAAMLKAAADAALERKVG